MTRTPEEQTYLDAIRARVVAKGWNAADAELAFLLGQLDGADAEMAIPPPTMTVGEALAAIELECRK